MAHHGKSATFTYIRRKASKQKMNSFSESADHSTTLYSYLSRRHMIKLISWSIVGVGFLMAACDFNQAGPTLKMKREIEMESSISTSNIQNKIPPIDTLIPTITETATFALG
jgi:hypothetical protein